MSREQLDIPTLATSTLAFALVARQWPEGRQRATDDLIFQRRPFAPLPGPVTWWSGALTPLHDVT